MIHAGYTLLSGYLVRSSWEGCLPIACPPYRGLPACAELASARWPCSFWPLSLYATPNAPTMVLLQLSTALPIRLFACPPARAYACLPT